MMSEITTNRRIRSQTIKQEPELEPNNDSLSTPKFEYDSEQAHLNIADNPIACNKCKIDSVDPSDPSFVKEEIKTEELIVDDCMLFNNDVPLRIEENIFYYCAECSYETNDKKTLTDHVFAHRFQCNQCSYTTPDNYSLINHDLIHIKSGSSLDARVFTRPDVNEEKPTKRSFRCHDCGYQSDSKTTLKFHTKTHKTIAKFLCELCNFQTHSKNSLKSHWLTLHKIICARNNGPLKTYSKNRNQSISFSGEMIMVTSKERSNEAKIIECESSTNKERSSQQPVLHMGSFISQKTIDSEQVAFKCRFCDFSATNIKSLKDHWNAVHSDRIQYSCDECNYKSYTKTEFIRHKNIHYEKKPFKCGLCDYSCNFSSNLKVHLIKHSTEQPFSCDKCDYETKNETYLQRHKIIHFDKKQFKRIFYCDECDYKTRNKYHLQAHKIIHSKKKPIQCSLCDYSCNFTSNLKVHLKKHSIEKPFECK